MPPQLCHAYAKVDTELPVGFRAGQARHATECWRHGSVSPPYWPRCFQATVRGACAGADFVACVRRHLSGKVDGADRPAAGRRSGSLRLLGRQVGRAGKRFKANEVSCAHRTEAFGTIFVVTNLENGKKIRCRFRTAAPSHAAGFSISRSAPRARSVAMACAASPCAAPATSRIIDALSRRARGRPQ